MGLNYLSMVLLFICPYLSTFLVNAEIFKEYCALNDKYKMRLKNRVWP